MPSSFKTLIAWIAGFLGFLLLMFFYLSSGGLYKIVPANGCTVCAYKINKVTGTTWYLVRDHQFEVRETGKAGTNYIYNPHTGTLEPE